MSMSPLTLQVYSYHILHALDISPTKCTYIAFCWTNVNQRSDDFHVFTSVRCMNFELLFLVS